MINRMDNEGDSRSPSQTNSHVTIADYAARHGISESTIRRRIKAGLLDAELRGGRYMIADDVADDGLTSQDEQPDRGADERLVDQMQSEIDNLRGQLSNRDTQIDQLNQILAMTTAQNSTLTQQLPAPRKPILDRLKSLFGSQA